MSNSYLLQGEVMDISIGSFQIPVASLSLFDSAVIILLVPLLDVVIFPFIARFGLRPTMLQRIGENLVYIGSKEKTKQITFLEGTGLTSRIKVPLSIGENVHVIHKVPRHYHLQISTQWSSFNKFVMGCLIQYQFMINCTDGATF